MIWSFTKMHGNGNDFVVLDGVRQHIELTADLARAIADRHRGVGCDQILLVEPPQHPQADFRYRIFNADGSEVEHCGNGARCFVRFVHDSGLSSRNPLRAEIATGHITLHAQENGQVSVNMGPVSHTAATLGFDTTNLPTQTCGNDTLYSLPLSDEFGEEHVVWLSLVAISNPHAVQLVTNVELAPVSEIGPRVACHPRFANRVNAGFMEVIDRHHIRLRVYERGSGETLSCGTGACAAVASGIRRGLLESPVTVDTRGGQLTIALENGELIMTGSAIRVFEGKLDPAHLLSRQ